MVINSISTNQNKENTELRTEAHRLDGKMWQWNNQKVHCLDEEMEQLKVQIYQCK